jgi:hypothetical protein
MREGGGISFAMDASGVAVRQASYHGDNGIR